MKHISWIILIGMFNSLPTMAADSGWSQDCKIYAFKGTDTAGLTEKTSIKNFTVLSSCFVSKPGASFCQATVVENGVAANSVSLANKYGQTGVAYFNISDPVTFRPGPNFGIIVEMRDSLGHKIARGTGSATAKKIQSGVGVEYFNAEATDGLRFDVECTSNPRPSGGF